MISKIWIYCFGVTVCLISGCATWMPSGEQPRPIEAGVKTPPLSDEAVAIETYLIRLKPEQVEQSAELWSLADQQILPPELRLNLDRNGVRVAKISGSLPRVLESWLSETEKRIESDPLEQTGLAADVISVARHWRCRAGVRKEIPIRDLSKERVTLFYHDQAFKGRALDSPRFFFSMTATPGSDYTADVRLTPEIEHGDYRNRVVVREAALRPVSERDTIPFNQLAIHLRLQRGDCLVIGPTAERCGLGAEFLHSRTQENLYEPVLMLVRLSQSGVDSIFSPESAAKAQKAKEL